MDQALTMAHTAEWPLLNLSICLRSLEKSFIPGWNIWLVTEKERICWRKGMTHVFLLHPPPVQMCISDASFFNVDRKDTYKMGWGGGEGRREKSWKQSGRQMSTDASQPVPSDGAVTKLQTWQCTQRALRQTLLQFWMLLGTSSSQMLSLQPSSAAYGDNVVLAMCEQCSLVISMNSLSGQAARFYWRVFLVAYFLWNARFYPVKEQDQL